MEALKLLTSDLTVELTEMIEASQGEADGDCAEEGQGQAGKNSLSCLLSRSLLQLKCSPTLSHSLSLTNSRLRLA